MSNSTNLILRGIEPLPKWPDVLKKTNTEAIYSVLIGAAASLLQCERLIESLLKRPSARGSNQYNSATLYNELKGMSESPGPMLAWDHNPNLLSWSAGFFLNRAQHNVAAAMDKCLTAWLAIRLKMPVKHRFTEDMWTSTWMLTRLYLLRAIVGAQNVKAVEALIRAFGDDNLGDTDAAAERLTLLIRRAKDSRNTREALTLVGKLCDGACCAAIVVGRTNSFKHRILGLEWEQDRKLGRRPRLLAEFALTALGYDCVAKLWKGLVSEGVSREKTPPMIGGARGNQTK